MTLGARAIGGGVLFFLVALSLVLDPYSKHATASTPSTENPPLGAPAEAAFPMQAMLGQLVPQIVTPYGIAAVLLVLTLMPGSTTSTVGILIGIMALNLVAMIFAGPILRVAAFSLQILGTVLGVLQVALSVQVIVYGVRPLAVEKFGAHFPSYVECIAHHPCIVLRDAKPYGAWLCGPPADLQNHCGAHRVRRAGVCASARIAGATACDRGLARFEFFRYGSERTRHNRGRASRWEQAREWVERPGGKQPTHRTIA